MTEQKRFQNQTLNSDDYEKIEEGAKLVKDGSKLLLGVFFVCGLVKKYGPEILKGINKIRKS